MKQTKKIGEEYLHYLRFIFKTITGEGGYFDTRIVYVLKLDQKIINKKDWLSWIKINLITDF